MTSKTKNRKCEIHYYSHNLMSSSTRESPAPAPALHHVLTLPRQPGVVPADHSRGPSKSARQNHPEEKPSPAESKFNNSRTNSASAANGPHARIPSNSRLAFSPLPLGRLQQDRLQQEPMDSGMTFAGTARSAFGHGLSRRTLVHAGTSDRDSLSLCSPAQTHRPMSSFQADRERMRQPSGSIALSFTRSGTEKMPSPATLNAGSHARLRSMNTSYVRSSVPFKLSGFSSSSSSSSLNGKGSSNKGYSRVASVMAESEKNVNDVSKQFKKPNVISSGVFSQPSEEMLNNRNIIFSEEKIGDFSPQPRDRESIRSSHRCFQPDPFKMSPPSVLGGPPSPAPTRVTRPAQPWDEGRNTVGVNDKGKICDNEKMKNIRPVNSKQQVPKASIEPSVNSSNSGNLPLWRGSVQTRRVTTVRTCSRLGMYRVNMVSIPSELKRDVRNSDTSKTINVSHSGESSVKSQDSGGPGSSNNSIVSVPLAKAAITVFSDGDEDHETIPDKKETPGFDDESKLCSFTVPSVKDTAGNDRKFRTGERLIMTPKATLMNKDATTASDRIQSNYAGENGTEDQIIIPNNFGQVALPVLPLPPPVLFSGLKCGAATERTASHSRSPSAPVFLCPNATCKPGSNSSRGLSSSGVVTCRQLSASELTVSDAGGKNVIKRSSYDGIHCSPEVDELPLLELPRAKTEGSNFAANGSETGDTIKSDIATDYEGECIINAPRPNSRGMIEEIQSCSSDDEYANEDTNFTAANLGIKDVLPSTTSGKNFKRSQTAFTQTADSNYIIRANRSSLEIDNLVDLTSATTSPSRKVAERSALRTAMQNIENAKVISSPFGAASEPKGSQVHNKFKPKALTSSGNVVKKPADDTANYNKECRTQDDKYATARKDRTDCNGSMCSSSASTSAALTQSSSPTQGILPAQTIGGRSVPENIGNENSNIGPAVNDGKTDAKKAKKSATTVKSPKQHTSLSQPMFSSAHKRVKSEAIGAGPPSKNIIGAPDQKQPDQHKLSHSPSSNPVTKTLLHHFDSSPTPSRTLTPLPDKKVVAKAPASAPVCGLMSSTTSSSSTTASSGDAHPQEMLEKRSRRTASNQDDQSNGIASTSGPCCGKLTEALIPTPSRRSVKTSALNRLSEDSSSQITGDRDLKPSSRPVTSAISMLSPSPSLKREHVRSFTSYTPAASLSEENADVTRGRQTGGQLRKRKSELEEIAKEDKKTEIRKAKSKEAALAGRSTKSRVVPVQPSMRRELTRRKTGGERIERTDEMWADNDSIMKNENDTRADDWMRSRFHSSACL